MKRVAIASLLLAALLTDSACKPEAPRAPQNSAPIADAITPATSATRQAATLAYHCDGLEFTVRYEDDHVILQGPKQAYLLPQVHAADGAKFARDSSTFWSKGEDAVVTLAGKPYTNCHEQLVSEAPPAS